MDHTTFKVQEYFEGLQFFVRVYCVIQLEKPFSSTEWSLSLLDANPKSARSLFIALVGFTFIVMNIGIFRGPSGVKDFLALEKSRGILSSAVDKLKEENEHIAEELNKIKSSPSYAKKILRDKYHVMDEDEDIIFFAE